MKYLAAYCLAALSGKAVSITSFLKNLLNFPFFFNFLSQKTKKHLILFNHFFNKNYSFLNFFLLNKNKLADKELNAVLSSVGIQPDAAAVKAVIDALHGK